MIITFLSSHLYPPVSPARWEKYFSEEEKKRHRDAHVRRSFLSQIVWPTPGTWHGLATSPANSSSVVIAIFITSVEGRNSFIGSCSSCDDLVWEHMLHEVNNGTRVSSKFNGITAFPKEWEDEAKWFPIIMSWSSRKEAQRKLLKAFN